MKTDTLNPAFIIILILILAPLAHAGELSFEVIPSNQILEVGDTLTLTMKVMVYDSPETIDAEPLSKLELPGFTTVSTSPRHKRGREGEHEYEERITTFKLVAEESGTYTIPSFEIPYSGGDDIGGEKTLTSQELTITVAPQKTLGTKANTVYIIGVFLVVVLVSVGGFLIWFRRIKSRQFKDEEEINIKTKFENWAAELEKLLANGKKDTFTQQAFNYVNEFIEDSYNIGLKGKKFDKRMLILHDRGVNIRLIELFKTTWHQYEEFEYGGMTHNSDELSELLQELKNLDQYIEKTHTR